jgi:ceramide glucosyltransferase
MLIDAVVLIALASLLITLTGYFALYRSTRRPETSWSSWDGFPPISVLKPLKGIDDDLLGNLRSFALQRYPRYELVLGAADPDDPALAVAERLAREHPDLPITIVRGARRFGMNPKVSLLAALEAAAQHAHVLVSDSNVRAHPEYLEQMARPMVEDVRVGMVTSLVAGVGERSLGALLENLHLNAFVAPAVAGAEWLSGHAVVVGKSMLFRRSDLLALGGWAVVKDVLAEDYILGRGFARLGLEVAFSRSPIATVNQERPVREFIGRHRRWCQLRRHVRPALYLSEPLMNPIPVLLILAAFAEPHIALAAILLVPLKCAADGVVASRLRAEPIAWRQLPLIPLKDLLMLGVWVEAAFRRTVSWRGNRMRIGAGSRLTPLPSDA